MVISLFPGPEPRVGVRAVAPRTPSNLRKEQATRYYRRREEDPLPPDLVGKPQDAEKISVTTQMRKRGCRWCITRRVPDCDRSEKGKLRDLPDGTQQVIPNFATPEAPITVAMVVEYSKWTELFGYTEAAVHPGTYEVIRPTAMFLQQFIKPPDDYVSVVACDIRPLRLRTSRMIRLD